MSGEIRGDPEGVARGPTTKPSNFVAGVIDDRALNAQDTTAADGWISGGLPAGTSNRLMAGLLASLPPCRRPHLWKMSPRVPSRSFHMARMSSTAPASGRRSCCTVTVVLFRPFGSK
jgi:hypothetical protein